MATFPALRRKLHQRLLYQRLRQQRYPRYSVRFEQAKSIGILFDGTELPDRNAVLQFAQRLRADGKSVKLLGYLDSDFETDSFTFKKITRKELDWLLRPKNPDAADFLDQSYDILLNLSLEANLVLEYVAALSKAHYRVGIFTPNTWCYELMIDLPPKGGVPELIKQIEFFLQKMESTHEAVKV
jgi:hypothetical protein